MKKDIKDLLFFVVTMFLFVPLMILSGDRFLEIMGSVILACNWLLIYALDLKMKMERKLVALDEMTRIAQLTGQYD